MMRELLIVGAAVVGVLIVFGLVVLGAVSWWITRQMDRGEL